jgi:hypothetical protein
VLILRFDKTNDVTRVVDKQTNEKKNKQKSLLLRWNLPKLTKPIKKNNKQTENKLMTSNVTRFFTQQNGQHIHGKPKKGHTQTRQTLEPFKCFWVSFVECYHKQFINQKKNKNPLHSHENGCEMCLCWARCCWARCLAGFFLHKKLPKKKTVQDLIYHLLTPNENKTSEAHNLKRDEK